MSRSDVNSQKHVRHYHFSAQFGDDRIKASRLIKKSWESIIDSCREYLHNEKVIVLQFCRKNIVPGKNFSLLVSSIFWLDYHYNSSQIGLHSDASQLFFIERILKKWDDKDNRCGLSLEFSNSIQNKFWAPTTWGLCKKGLIDCNRSDNRFVALTKRETRVGISSLSRFADHAILISCFALIGKNLLFLFRLM